jgi:hypothetical protein
MASYDATVNSGNPTAQGRGPAFAPMQSPAVAAAGAPVSPPQGGMPQGSPGMPPGGSVAPPGAFPAGSVPPQLANMLMGMNGTPGMTNPVPNMPGSPGGAGGGAFSSGFGPGQGMGMGMARPGGPAAPMTASQGAFGRMGPTAGTPAWGGPGK